MRQFVHNDFCLQQNNGLTCYNQVISNIHVIVCEILNIGVCEKIIRCLKHFLKEEK
jgi:hypothetical protein